jgi:hypothetical protein
MHKFNYVIIQYYSVSLIIIKIVAFKPLIGDNSQIFLSKVSNLDQWVEIHVAIYVHGYEPEDIFSY